MELVVGRIEALKNRQLLYLFNIYNFINFTILYKTLHWWGWPRGVWGTAELRAEIIVLCGGGTVCCNRSLRLNDRDVSVHNGGVA